MPRDTGRNDHRSRIAYLAARLMAEDGIEDYALAKRKAARQAGAPETRELPANDEIDEALRAYQQIYHRGEHRDRLRALREAAVRAMRDLARFNPHLTGSVLNGNAGRYADINLQLFTDNEKAVELYLIDRGIPYRTTQARLYSGEDMRTVPVYT
ncbi:MAG: UDP-N-acetylmuramate--alanine ligase, partial [Burkholderiales bacterium]